MSNNFQKISQALQFMAIAHDGQYRKNSGHPYIVHTIAVASIVEKYYPLDFNSTVYIAALLHDTIEDTDVTYTAIIEKFGSYVANVVKGCTKIEKDPSLNRQQRTELNKERWANSSLPIRIIKVADMIDNLSDVHELDKDFALMYLKEKHELLYAIKHGVSEEMVEEARLTIERGYAKLMYNALFDGLYFRLF